MSSALSSSVSATLTFDLTAEQTARLDAVREMGERTVGPAASAIDSTGTIPDAVARAIEALDVWRHGAMDAVLALEELAAASGSAAARAALGTGDAAEGAGLTGLRGVAAAADPTDAHRLGLAAVAVGLGRRAVAEALGAVKAHGGRAGGDPADPPYWALADAATEIEAARLIVRAAAGAADLSGAAAALVFAGGAAVRAADAAARVVGAEALRAGSVLERCARDARATLFIVGTEDATRAIAADRLLTAS